jgi:hypothetical protein
VPRNLAIGYKAVIARVVTAPIHLVEITGLHTKPILFTDGEKWKEQAGRIYANVDCKIAGFRLSSDAAQSTLTITASNLDGEPGRALQNGNVRAARVIVYVGDEEAPGIAHRERIGEWQIAGAQVTPERVTLALQPLIRYVPSRTVDEANGFNFATPIGTRWVFGGEVFILGE